MRIAVLQVDWVNPELIAEHGDLPDMLSGFLASNTRSPAEINVFKVLEGQLPQKPEQYDLLLIPGSRFSAHREFSGRSELLGLLAASAQRGVKMLGLCFGAQLLAVSLGGNVDASEYGWNVGLKRVTVVSRPDWLAHVDADPVVLFNHRDRIRSLPDRADCIFSLAECPIAGFRVGTSIVGLQFHPEYTLEYQEALMRVSPTLGDSDLASAVVRNRELQRDCGRIARPLLSSLLGVHDD